MKSLRSKLCWFAICLGLAACDISVTPGGIEDSDAPKVIEDLAPMPDGYLDFAAKSTFLFFTEGREGIKDRLHPAMDGVTGLQWSALEKFASDKADFDSAEYYGHGFGEADDLDVITIQIKVPFDNGYNLVQVIMPVDEDCCRIAGFSVDAKAFKTFKLGK